MSLSFNSRKNNMFKRKKGDKSCTIPSDIKTISFTQSKNASESEEGSNETNQSFSSSVLKTEVIDDSFDLFLPKKSGKRANSTDVSVAAFDFNNDITRNRNVKQDFSGSADLKPSFNNFKMQVHDKELEKAIALSLEESKTNNIDTDSHKSQNSFEETILFPNQKKIQEFKGKSKKFCRSKPLLLCRTKQERESIMTEKVAIILMETSKYDKPEGFSENTSLNSTLLKNCHCEESHLWKKSSMSPMKLASNDFYIPHFQENEKYFYFDPKIKRDSVSPLDGKKESSCFEETENLPEHLGSIGSDKEKSMFQRYQEELSISNFFDSPVPCSEPNDDIICNQDSTNLMNIDTIMHAENSNEELDSLKSLSNDWGYLVGNSEMSDIIILLSKGDKMCAHSLVFLARCSMILSDVKQDDETSEKILIWSDVSFEACSALLNYFYTGKVNHFVQILNADLQSLKPLVQKYKITELGKVLNIEPSIDKNLSSMKFIENVPPTERNIELNVECDSLSDATTRGVISDDSLNFDRTLCSITDQRNDKCNLRCTSALSDDTINRACSPDSLSEIIVKQDQLNESFNWEGELNMEESFSSVTSTKENQSNECSTYKLVTDDHNRSIDIKPGSSSKNKVEDGGDFVDRKPFQEFSESGADISMKSVESNDKQNFITSDSQKGFENNVLVAENKESPTPWRNSLQTIDNYIVNDEIDLPSAYDMIHDYNNFSCSGKLISSPFHQLDPELALNGKHNISIFPLKTSEKSVDQGHTEDSSNQSSISKNNNPKISLERFFHDSFPSNLSDFDVSEQIQRQSRVDETCKQEIRSSTPSLERRDICCTPSPVVTISEEATPLPNYSMMISPDLKDELRKYGIKPGLERRKAKMLLRYIYDQIHPVVDSVNKSENESGKVKDIQNESFESSDDIISLCSDDSIQSCTSLPSSTYSDSKAQENTDLMVDEERNAQTDGSHIDVAKAVKNFIRNNDELFESVIQYTPIWLHKFHQTLKENGIKCKLNELMDILDDACITFRVEKSARKIKKSRGTKRAKLDYPSNSKRR